MDHAYSSNVAHNVINYRDKYFMIGQVIAWDYCVHKHPHTTHAHAHTHTHTHAHTHTHTHTHTNTHNFQMLLIIDSYTCGWLLLFYQLKTDQS